MVFGKNLFLGEGSTEHHVKAIAFHRFIKKKLYLVLLAVIWKNHYIRM